MNDLHRRLLAAFRLEYRDHLDTARRMLDAVEAAGWAPDAIDLVELYRRLHSLKGAARAVDLRSVEALAHRLETLVGAVQKQPARLDAAAALALRRAFDAIEDGMAAVPEDGQVAIPEAVVAEIEGLAGSGPGRPAPPVAAATPPPPPTAPPAAPPGPAEAEAPVLPRSLRVEAEALDGLLETSVEIVAAAAAQQRLVMEVQALEQQAAEARRAIDVLRRLELQRPHAGNGGASNGRISAVRGRHLAALESRIGRFEGRLRDFGDRQRAGGRQLGQLGARLEGHVRRLRLVPAEAVLGDMRKVVGDLAAEQGKTVRGDMRGLDTLADRAVLQRLREPVLHLLRNAVSHGIEAPAARAAAGKPAEARVLLDLSARAGRLLLRVEDDGRGVDVERLRQAALAQGHRPEEAALRGDPRALAGLLAQPGLSTAETVTEVSGRGIGLSAVAAAVDAMLGDFLVAPRAGGGTVAALSVPISASATTVVTLLCRGRLYGIPAHAVEKLHRVPRDRVESLEGWPVARVDDGAPVRLLALADLLGADGPDTAAGAPLLPVLVLRARGARIGLLVDRLAEVREGFLRDLGPAAGAHTLGAVLSDAGEVIPVIDAEALLEAAGGTAARPLIDDNRRAIAALPTILVVDDSITTRTLEKSILEANGFRVRLSVDGADALDQLHAQAVDLVISDVEMPRMDGFELVRAMKRESALARIPVILVTSRDSDDDRRRGLALGADAYVVKQRFDQTDLLATIGQLL